MKNWTRHYNAEGVHALWSYTDSHGALQRVRCDENGWIDAEVLLPPDGCEVQICSSSGFRAYDQCFRSHWREGDFYGGVAGWQPKPLAMVAKS